IPGIWNNTTEKLFTNGIGRENELDIVTMESSGPYSTKYIGHFMRDTKNQLP
ncbi:hypothetical protein BY458DRAFT_428300, partial [Sporodiniella umbellata]